MDSEVPVLNFTEAGSRGTPANASGLYRCILFTVENGVIFPVAQETFTVTVQGVLLLNTRF